MSSTPNILCLIVPNIPTIEIIITTIPTKMRTMAEFRNILKSKPEEIELNESMMSEEFAISTAPAIISINPRAASIRFSTKKVILNPSCPLFILLLQLYIDCIIF